MLIFSLFYLKCPSLQCGGSLVRNPPASAGDVNSILGSGRSLGVENGNPHQYSCLDRGAWWAIVYEVSESDMTQQLKQQWTVSDNEKPTSHYLYFTKPWQSSIVTVSSLHECPLHCTQALTAWPNLLFKCGCQHQLTQDLIPLLVCPSTKTALHPAGSLTPTRGMSFSLWAPQSHPRQDVFCTQLRLCHIEPDTPAPPPHHCGWPPWFTRGSDGLC